MLSKACKYGIRAALYLASAARNDKRIGVHELAGKLKVPEAFLAKILQQLAREGIVSSVKGPHGGFYMTPGNLDQPLLRVIEVIDGKHLFSECIMGLSQCSSKSPCVLHGEMAKFKLGLYNVAGYQTIGELAESMPDGLRESA